MSRARSFDFLLIGTQPVWRDQQTERLRTLFEYEVPWAEIIREAIPHGLLPLLAWNLECHAGELVPEATLGQLQRYRLRSAIRSRTMMAELISILGSLGAEGIRALPHKGPVLELLAYGQAGLRESHDLDIWVARSDLRAAGAVLRSAGYRDAAHIRGEIHSLPFAQGASQKEFVHTVTGLVVELHCEKDASSLGYGSRFDDIWDRRGEIQADGISVPSFHIRDLIVSLAVHGAKHRWRRLNWITDIAALAAKHPELEWERLVYDSRSWGCSRRVSYAGLLAADLYDLELTGLRKEKITHPYSIKVARGDAAEETEHSATSYLRQLREQLAQAETLRGQFHLAFHSLRHAATMREEAMTRPLSPRASTLYRFRSRMRGALFHRGRKTPAPVKGSRLTS